MRFPLIPAIIILLLNCIVDYYIYRQLRARKAGATLAKTYLLASAAVTVYIIIVVCMPKRNGSDSTLLFVMWSIFAYLTIYLPKYVYLIFRFLSNLPRLWKAHRWRWLTTTGTIISIATFLIMWWGALINRYNIQKKEIEVNVADLPPSFQDFKLAQISDLHVGTYGQDTTFISALVDSVNAAGADMIVFTGDLVNRHAKEFEPFVSVLSRLRAPYGVYSIMGNHDYGDYSDWDTPEAKEADIAHLQKMQARAGMKMLNNATTWIHKGADSIALIGVENIGDPPFKIYGDLKAAYPDLDDSNTKILLTHNPAHWEDEIEDRPTNVALTLSGHTHAMQCEISGLSPAALRYDKWGGKYTDHNGQHLYVNIGAGTVGMPYRIGATPEITVLTLRR